MLTPEQTAEMLSLQERLAYLDLRGLIERHPSQPWMRVREEA